MSTSGTGVCPACRDELVARAEGVSCPRCHVVFPVAEGITFYGEPCIDGDEAARFVEESGERVRAFAELREARRRRGHGEPYAWFRPFNESSRALEPLLPILAAALGEGGRLLDLWNRTGWTGAWLAGLFPDTEVVSLWEGDTDQLGYGGFLSCFGGRKLPDNLTLAFVDPAGPLPFGDDTFAVVNGLDTLHRYAPSPLIGEVLRVGTPDCAAVFPHVHLSNHEPDPWFERGGTQRHGREWGAYFDRVLADDDRRAWVMSEARLYEQSGALVIEDERDTAHYNGLVLVAGEQWDGEVVSAPAPPVGSPSASVLVNPLVEIDLTTGELRLDDADPAGIVAYMAVRHRVCVDALVLEPPLHSREVQTVVHARAGLRIGEIAEQLDTTVESLAAVLEGLVRRGLVVVAELPRTTVDVQRSYQDLRAEGDDFGALWEVLAERYGDRAVLRGDDGSSFGVDDLTLLTDALLGLFSDVGLAPGDAIAILAEPHPEYVITVWAAWRAGLVVVPLPTRFRGDALGVVADDLRIGLVFVDDAHRTRAPEGARTVVFDPDDPEVPLGPDHLAAVIEPWLGGEPTTTTAPPPGAPAVVLFTSGSTGSPKGVELTMRSLMQTSAALAEWSEIGHADVLMSTSGFHTMSGLRNPSLVALRSGATVVVPGSTGRHALGAAEIARRLGVTVVASGPGLLMALERGRERLPSSRPLGAVRSILTTGAPLDPDLAERTAAMFGIELGDYYGLTETGGFCGGSLGRAVGAAVEVHRDGRRAEIGEPGEIRVSGPSIATRYVGADSLARRDGWVYTGDRGVVGADGVVRLLGRDDGILKNRDGERVSGPEIEEVMATAAEVGELHAFVVAARDVDPDDGGLVADLRQRVHHELGAAKTPDRIDVVDALPGW